MEFKLLLGAAQILKQLFQSLIGIKWNLNLPAPAVRGTRFCTESLFQSLIGIKWNLNPKVKQLNDDLWEFQSLIGIKWNLNATPGPAGAPGKQGAFQSLIGIKWNLNSSILF